MQPNIIIYDAAMNMLAILENAFAISYQTPLNSLWTASFSLPADDEKNEECLPLRYVEIFDGSERVDLFRIVPNTATRDNSGQIISYQCEHVLATLLDDVLFQFHQIGGSGVPMVDVIDYILAQQTTVRWQSGTIDFTTEFEYSFENENLLGAMFAIPKPLTEEYELTWDTSSYPWTYNIVAPEDGVQAYIRYGLNLVGIEKETDPSDLCTRLYCLGYGEGVNQLTIKDVNGGIPYIDSDTIETYGTISRIFTDRTITNAELLMARGQASLDEIKIPRITYTVDAAELYALTDDPLDKFTTGKQVRVIDEELGIDIIARVVNRGRPDITGQPGSVTLEIANKTIDVADSIASLSDRQRINETYAQGATNIDSQSFADNCDPTHPMVIRLWVPDEAVRINKLLLSYSADNYRAYERAIEGGGAITKSTESGGALTTSSGPSSLITTENATVTNSTYTGSIIFESGNYISGVISSAGSHNHGGAAGSHNHGNPDNNDYAPPITSDGSHAHNLLFHYHEFYSEPHTHGMDHTHTILLPDHTHDVVLPNHTHGIEFGIYEGPTPEAITVSVDDNVIPGLGTSESNVDLIPFLSVDDEGKILRGQFHEIKITPDDLGRIVATVILQCFVNSRGGGNY